MIPNPQIICFVIPKYATFSTGGAELQVHLLTQQFLQLGWQVEVICRGWEYRNEVKKSPFYDDRIKYRYYKASGLRCLEFFSVARLLLKSRAQWYYNRTDDAATAAMTILARVRGQKSIYALASDDDAGKNKYQTIFKNFIYNNPFKKFIRKADITILDRMVEYGKKNCNIVLFQTAHQQKLFLKNFVREGHIVSNSIIINTLKDSIKENIILWVGNFRSVKQPELFISIAKSLCKCQGWRFVMIGQPDDSNLALLKEMDDEPCFSFLGSLSYAETLNWFSKSKVYVNTSSVEGFPNTFIQSWLSRCLVLSLNADPDKLLSDGQLGIVFNGDTEALRQQLIEIIEGTTNYTDTLKRSIEYASNQFDLAQNTQKIIKIMHQHTQP